MMNEQHPLVLLQQQRQVVLQRVIEQTCLDFAPDLALGDAFLGETLYAEKMRLKREKRILGAARVRQKKDRRLWRAVQAGLLSQVAQVSRKDLLKQVVSTYAEEIGGFFDPRVYHLTTQLVPFGFRWLLNVRSVSHFFPWSMTEELSSVVRLVGRTTHLQKLAQKGTILLVPTHQSHLDSLLVGYAIFLLSLPPFSYGAGLNLFSNPLVSFVMSRLGAYTVDRQKRNDIYKRTLKNYSTAILQEGVHSIFFPGGGRSRTGAIETRLKLGLLGTGLQAELRGHLSQQPRPRVYVVPLVMSYSFVLEAAALIESHLQELGRHRFFSIVDDPWKAPLQVGAFFWKWFSVPSSLTVRVGQPLDVFGNCVNEEGESMGPNGTRIDPKQWLTTLGELKADAQRDQEYTRELGARLVERFHEDHTLLPAHVVSFSFFEGLRKKYPDLDLFRFLRLSLAQRTWVWKDFCHFTEILFQKLQRLSDQGKCFLADDFWLLSFEEWVQKGVLEVGRLHRVSVLKKEGNLIYTEDMNLLYYYRNRLSGYGLSLFGGVKKEYDDQGFLV